MTITQLYQHYQQSYKVCTDTRKITKDCIFFALKGDNFNGNSFAADAIDKGASLALVDEREFQTHSKIILVDNVLISLQQLASYHRDVLGIPVLALTGSNGKTTTKELIHAVLKTRFNTCATVGNLNNHIGVPMTLLSMSPETEIAIIEMGANHLKEIQLLCSIAKPNYGYITNFGKAHLEGFGSLEGVIKGKSELYDFLKSGDGLVFVNANDQTQLNLTVETRRFTFDGPTSDVHIELIGMSPFIQLQFKALTYETNLIGAYNIPNVMAAIAIGYYFKIEPQDIKTGIEQYIPKNNRSQLLEKNSNTIILDAYNANPSSMEAALSHFSNLKSSYKVIILGDMFELGAMAAEEHQNLVNRLEGLNIDSCFLIGENFYKTKTTHSKIKQFKSFDAFKKAITTIVFKDTAILIKGSRGMALERVYELL